MSKITNQTNIWIDWVAEDSHWDTAQLVFSRTGGLCKNNAIVVKEWKRPAELSLSRAQLEREVRMFFRNIHPTYIQRLTDATLLDLLKSMGRRAKLSPEVRVRLT